MPVLCVRLKQETTDILRQMAQVDGRDVEERLSEILEELVARSQV